MPTIISHPAAALALGSVFRNRDLPARCWILGAVCTVVPDLDVVGLRLGIPYRDLLGHRGISHSITFAALLALAVTWLAFRDARFDGRRTRLWMFFFLATVSHGVLDAMTTGGGGVAFLAPFSVDRYFLPWRPIEVSPISIRRFLSPRGASVLASELRWIWVPALVVTGTALLVRRRRGGTDGEPKRGRL